MENNSESNTNIRVNSSTILSSFWFWALVIFAVIFFTQVPSQRSISSKTHLITQPRTPDGKRVDYYEALFVPYHEALAKPVENGYRLLTAALGKKALPESNQDDFCRQLHISTPVKAQHPGFCLLEVYLKNHAVSVKDILKEFSSDPLCSNAITSSESDEVYEKYESLVSNNAWTDDQRPLAGQWLKEVNPVLDITAQAVRMPVFCTYVSRSKALFMIEAPFPITRELARCLEVRIANRIGTGDLDGAIDDIITMRYLASHTGKIPFLTNHMLGIAISQMTDESISLLIHSSRPTLTQLERLESELKAIPPLPSMARIFEEELHVQYDGIDFLYRNRSLLNYGFLEILPWDEGIIRRKYTQLIHPLRELILETDRTKRQIWEEQIQSQHERFRKLDNESIPNRIWRIATIQNRSSMVADRVFMLFVPAIQTVDESCRRAELGVTLVYTAIAVEKYQRETGAYPQTLAELIPKYLSSVPLDPYANGQTLIYKLNPVSLSQWQNRQKTRQAKQGKTLPPDERYYGNSMPFWTPYLLYSIGYNEVDDGGVKASEKINAYSCDWVF